MTLITGKICDSAGQPLTGVLTVTLDAPMASGATQMTLYARSFTVLNGDLTAANINVPASYAQQTTYRIKYVTVSDGVELTWLDFHCLVPAEASVPLSQLTPTGVVAETLDTSIRRIANLLITDPVYLSKLTGFTYVGDWRDDTLYYRGNVTKYDGSSYIYIAANPSIGNLVTDNAYWQLVASKGDTGSGTTGNDTPYNATTWLGQTDAPSRNSIRNVLESQFLKTSTANLAQYAPLANAAFTGTPTAPVPTELATTTQLANCQWVDNYFIRKSNPALTVNPPAGSDNLSLASTQWVNARITSAGGFAGGGVTVDLSPYATLTNPTFTGAPKVPTPVTTDNSTTIPNTSWVKAQIAAIPSGGSSSPVTINTVGGVTTFNYGSGWLQMMGTASLTRSDWTYNTDYHLDITLPYSLTTFANVQATWIQGHSQNNGYSRFRAYVLGVNSIRITFKTSYTDAGVTLRFYWNVWGQQ